MFEIKQSREKFIKNQIIRHVASHLSALWYGSSSSIWMGNLEEGHCLWQGDDGAEFLTIWNAKALLAVACIIECPRFPEMDNGWDEEKSPSGKKRGLQYLNNPPDEVQLLYKKSLNLLGNEFVTSGLWGSGDQIVFSDPSEEALECGLEYFVEFGVEPEKFLTVKTAPFVDSLSEHFGFTKKLLPITQLAWKIADSAFNGLYKLSANEREILSIEITSENGNLEPLMGRLSYLNDNFKEIGVSIK